MLEKSEILFDYKNMKNKNFEIVSIIKKRKKYRQKTFEDISKSFKLFLEIWILKKNYLFEI